MFKLLNDDIALLDEKSPEDVFVKISQSVANLIRNSGSRFSIGIYGEWGTGKTTLMRMIERQLNSFLKEDLITLNWNNLITNDRNEAFKLKQFLKNQFKLSWIEDSELRYEESSKNLLLSNRTVENNRSTRNPKRGKLTSVFSFLFNSNRVKATIGSVSDIHTISIRYDEGKNEATMKIGNYSKTLTGEKGIDGNITLHLKENEILTVWFDAWRYEREEQFALLAFMKTIAYTMADIPYYQDVKKILLRGVGIVGKDVLRHFATQYAMTSEGWSELEQKLLPQMDLLATVDKDTIYFEGLQKIKEEMKKITNTHKIVIFIDDLDRCNAKKALEVFESTKAFLDIEGFIFVIGLSVDTLYKLITKEYEGVEIKGEEYIRKIIQVNINLPAWDQARIGRVIREASEVLSETDHEIFKDTELMANAADYNPREIKRIINRFTISSYLDEIDPTIFLIIQAFESRWYDNLYRNLDDSEFRKGVTTFIKKRPGNRVSYIESRKLGAIGPDGSGTNILIPLSDSEKSLFAIDKSFWDFVDNKKYRDKIFDIIRNWEVYKGKYKKSAEPTEQIKTVQKMAVDKEQKISADQRHDTPVLEIKIMKELCEKYQDEEISVSDIRNIYPASRENIESFLESLERRTHYIERLSNGNIRLTDSGRNYCRKYF